MKNSKAGLIIALASALVTVGGAAGGYYLGRLTNGIPISGTEATQESTTLEESIQESTT